MRLHALVRGLPAEALLGVGVVIWSLNFSAIKLALRHGFEPMTLVPVRWLAAAAVLTPLGLRTTRSLRVAGRRDVALVALAVVVGIWANQLMFVESVDLAPAATVAVVFGLVPIFVGLFAQAVGIERLGAQHWAGTAVSFGGVALVSAGAGGGLAGDLGGTLLAVATVAAFAVYSVAIVPLIARYGTMRVNTLATLCGAGLIALTTLGPLVEQDWAAVDALGWGSALYAGLGSLVVGNALWLVGIDRVGPGRASVYANAQPFLGALFAVAILAESLTALQAAGGVVIAAGILLARRARAAALPAD